MSGTAGRPLRDAPFSPDDPVRVSICSITFNHAPFIRACLEGFLDQVCDFRVEVVIHDDASTDDTARIIAEYAARYPLVIRPILQTENQFSKGVNPYYAYVFPAARGDYLALCDGDDYWQDPGKLAAQVALMDAEPGVALTYGRTDAMKDGVLIRGFRGGAERDFTPDQLKCGGGVNTLTTCFRNVFRGPPPRFLIQSPIGDLTVWAVLGHHGSGRFMPDLVPTVYNLHPGGIFSQVPRERQTFMTIITLLNIAAYHGDRGDRAASRANLRRVVGQLALHFGLLAVIAEAVRKSASSGIRRLRKKLRRQP